MKSKFHLRLLMAILFISVTEKSIAQAPEWLWAEALGGKISHGQSKSIAVDAGTGDVYTSGYFSGSFDFDPGPGRFNLTSLGGKDMFISKCNSQGQFLWAKAIGGILDDVSSALVVNSESGDVFITGYFTGTVDFDPGQGTSNLISTGQNTFISKFDSAGHFEWARALGEMVHTYGDHSIAVDAGSGDVYIIGSFTNTVDFDPGAGTFNLISDGNGDMFISKLSSSGDFVWAIAMDGTGRSSGNTIAIDPQSGSVYTTGHFKGRVDADPGSGIFILNASEGIFVSKFDGGGNFIWANKIGTQYNSYGISIALDPKGSGAVYTSGEFNGIIDCDPGPEIFYLAGPGMFISKLDGSGNFVWAKKMGGSGPHDHISITSIAFDTTGNGAIYTSGYFSGEVDFDPGLNSMTLSTTIVNDNDIYYSKLDSSGNFVWVKQVIGPIDDKCFSIAVDPEGSGAIYSTGLANETVDFDPGPGTFNLSLSYDEDIFIAKLSGMGHFIWAEKMSTSTGNADLNCITIDPVEHEDIYMTGSFSGTVDFDPGPDTFNITSARGEDMYISKLDNSGQFLWAKSIGRTGPVYDYGPLTAVDPVSGAIYLTGNFFGTVDFDPGTDTFILTSDSIDYFFPSGDMFISKLDAAGNFVWAKAIDDGKEQLLYVTSIAIDPSGNRDIYTTGYFYGTVDFDPGPDTMNLMSGNGTSMFISKLDSSGNFVWAEAIVGAGRVYSYAMAIDPGNGAVYTTGYFIGTIDFDPGPDSFKLGSGGGANMFISKLNNSGDFEWAISGSGENISTGQFIATDPAGSGDIYIAGSFDGTFLDLTSAGSEDIFIAKIDSAGHFKWTKAVGGANSDYVESLVVDPAGNKGVYATGHFLGTVDFDPGSAVFNLSSNPGTEEMFISKLDGSGNFEWALEVNEYNGYSPCPIALDHSGHLFVSGSFQSPSISFGSTTLFNADSSGQSSDIFIAKLDTTFKTSVVNVDSKKYQINIYPNPATNELNVSFEENEAFNVGITMFNILGEVVLSSSEPYAFHKKTIDVSTLPSGIYLIELNIDGNRVVEKVVKE